MLLFHSVAERRRVPEIMDQSDLAPQRHVHALRGLARINRWSGSARLLWRPIFTYAMKTGRESFPATDSPAEHDDREKTSDAVSAISLLDVATGGGDVPIRLWHNARRAGLAVAIAGCDRSLQAIDHARRNGRACGADIHFFQWDVIQNGLPGDYDIVAASLFLHHLEEKQAVELLRAMARSARHLVLINDLVRSQAGYLLAYLGTHLLSGSDVVHTDGPRSVEAAFTLGELRALARRAGLERARVTRHWPCRVLLEWERS
jgi:2-polyprenyl-3-methyl-5-hydroxy-6-metoxy-1,4-benzoquinol methylase